MSRVTNTEPYQFDVMRLTGVQIFRRLQLQHLPQALQDRIWKAAPPPPLRKAPDRNGPSGKAPYLNDMIPLIRDFVACDDPGSVKCTDWMACSTHDGVFFRLLKIAGQLAADLVIDTQSGAGRMEDNLIHCLIPVRSFFRKTNHAIAQFHVVSNDDVRNAKPGSLIMDFGNTATCFIFADQQMKPQLAAAIELHNPFDPLDADRAHRPISEKQIFRSTAVLLRIQENASVSPWLLLGKSAEERIKTIDPNVSSLWAPKKHIRDLPDREVAIHCRGVVGQRVAPQPSLSFVKLIVEQMLTLSVSSQVNPYFGSKYPETNPKVMEVLFTYPLTWREQEIELFRRMVNDAASRIFVLPAGNRNQFRVHPVCSEPVAVAAYVLWSVFFQFHALLPEGRALLKPSLASNLLGNTEGEQEVTLLIVDAGGGSTDIALVKANWVVINDPVKGTVVSVHTQVVESLRYARAGDRLSHLMATAIFEYMREKYNVVENLDFNQKPSRAAFLPAYKRAAISEINMLVERAKTFLATNPDEAWAMSRVEEESLLAHLQAARASQDATVATFKGISLNVLRGWIEQDHAANSPGAEAGLMDIFYDLHQLGKRTRENGSFPHLVLLSGRTTRLSLFKSLLMEHLKIPAHRVRYIKDILPPTLQGQDSDNIDKLAVVQGAHRFKFGNPIQFVHHPTPQIFRRHIGTLESRPTGWELSNVLVEAGKSGTQSHVVTVAPHNLVRIGHAFQKHGTRAELIAVLENLTDDPLDVKLDFIDDYHLELNQYGIQDLMARHRNNQIALGRNPKPDSVPVRLTQHLPGGDDIADNYCDTGRIDLRNIVQKNRNDWIEAPQ